MSQRDPRLHTLLIHQSFVLPEDGGGTRHFELASRVVRDGGRFTIIGSTINYLTGDWSRASRQGAQYHQGVKVLHTYTVNSLHRSFVWRVVSFISFASSALWEGLRVKDVDVVMGSTPPIVQAPSAWLLAALRGKPFLLEVRDLWPDFAIAVGVLTNPVLIWLTRRLESFLYARADHIIVNSPAYRDYLLRKKVPEQKISFISNGVDPAMFDPDARGEAVREQYGLQGKFVVTYAGAMGMANDLEVVLQAAKQLVNDTHIHFLLVGEGKEGQHLREKVKQLGLNNVIFTGTLQKAQMKDVLAASDACVAVLKNIPEFRTTYPNKVFDYMAAGRPTVLAIDGVIRTVVEESGGGVYVPPGNPAAMADTIRSLAADPERAQALGALARAYVVKNFNRDDQARLFKELLVNLSISAAT